MSLGVKMVERLCARAELEELDWTLADLVRRLGMHRNTAAKWRRGVPGYAMAYLELAVRLKRVRDLADG